MEETHIVSMLELKKEEVEEEARAQLDIWKYIFGFAEQAVVKCAIELGIAEAIESHGRPITLSELSSTLGCDPSHLYRIMRFLIYKKIFKAIPTSHGCIGYSQTPLSRRLLKNGEKSMAALLLLGVSPVILAPWHSLSARVLANAKDGSFENIHGKDLWSFAEENLDHNNLFNEAMACDAKVVVPAIIKGCSEAFDGLGTVVDVGGGNGTSMSILVKACPWIQAINYDLPHVIASSPNIDGVKNEAGDMFQSVPKADVVFIQWVLHDWNDEDSIHILKNCRESVSKEKGRVLIIEAVIEEGGKIEGVKDVGLMLDMVMLTHTTGKERTLKEWEYVIKSAGFNEFTVKPIDAVQSVIMVFP